jgi:hypothetical protein
MIAALAVGAVLGGLLVGFEPVGGDPDRMYRPIKEELARALRRGALPLWSNALGLGVPLVAESHVAAFYPPNLIYAVLDAPTAYRLLMWSHLVALVATMHLYARSIGLTPWGAALASVAFALCGFQAVHATHEPFYTLAPYLPLALWLGGRFVETGRARPLALLSLVLGVQLTIGHFQMQMWTCGLVALTGAWRVIAERKPLRRAIGPAAAVAWGGAIAAVQLALSWDFARSVGHTERPLRDMAFFSFPPAHWIEPALPWFFRGLVHGGEDPYWFSLGTTGYEAMFYVGTAPLILAFVGAIDLGRDRPRTGFWRVVVVVSLALATMPHWWLEGYALLLKLPGLGYFRAPARYTLLTSFGLALLAGQGFDRTTSAAKHRAGLALAVLFALAAFGFGLYWSGRPDFRSTSRPGGLPFGMATGFVSWTVALVGVVLWRSGKAGAGLPMGLAVVELAALYFMGPTEWGWAVRLPGRSPVLAALAADPSVKRIGGVVDNLPLRAGKATATAYLGMTLSPINRWLRSLQERAPRHGPLAEHWQRRLGVTHSVWDDAAVFDPSAPASSPRDDPTLDVLVYRPVGFPIKRRWRVVTHGPPFPDVRAAINVRVAPNRSSLLDSLGREFDESSVWYERTTAPLDDSPRARSARVTAWDPNARVTTVEHDGSCDLVFLRAFDPGWTALVNDSPRAVQAADGGMVAVRLAGAGRSRVELRYRPRGLVPGAAVSLTALTLALATLVGGRFVGRRRG